MKDKPTLSVLMPNYNHAKFVGEALEAILQQSYRPIEVIVIDDASTDSSVEVIQQFAKRYPIIRLIQNENNMGVVHNLKNLSEIAIGNYIYLPGADDKIMPGFLEKSMEMLIEYPHAGLCSTLSYVINEEGMYQGLLRSAGIISTQKSFIPPEKAQKALLKYGSWILGNATIFRKKALLEAGGYIPELRSFADGFIQQVIALRDGVCFIPEPLVCWRKLESSYHLNSSKNLNVQLDIIKNATRLMSTTYIDLFPPKYVSRWEKKQLFLLNASLWSSKHKEQLNVLTCLKVPHTVVDKILLRMINILEFIQDASAKIYFLCIHRYFPIEVMRRELLSFFRKISLRFNKS